MKVSLCKVYIKGKVLLTFKDLVFIITWLFFLVCIADAMNGQPRGMTIFLGVWEILGIVYAFKIFDCYKAQKRETGQTNISENENRTEYRLMKEKKTTKPQFFES